MKIWKIAFPTGTRPDWESVDWKQSDEDIANILGVTINAVRRRRHIFAPDTIQEIKDHQQKKREEYINFWRTLDWSQSNIDIVNRYTVGLSTVIKYRKIFAPHTVREKNPEPDYSQVNWSQSNKTIGDQIGVSQSTVKRERERRGLPPSTWGNHFNIGSPKHPWELVDWSKSTSEIVFFLIDHMIKKYDLDPSEISPAYYSTLRSQVSTKRSNFSPNTLSPRGPSKKVYNEPLPEIIAETLNWYKIASRPYYLETVIDGKVMAGSDFTLVLDSPNITTSDIDERIKHLQRLSRNVKKFLRNVSSVELRLVDERDNVLNSFDVTEKILGFGDLLNSGVEFATNKELKREIGL